MPRVLLIALFALFARSFSASPALSQSERAASNHNEMTIAGPMAFLGDSLTTGAVSHPALSLHRPSVLKLLSGKSAHQLTLPGDIVALQSRLGLSPIDYERNPHPRRLGLSPAAFTGPLFWVYRHFSHAIAVNYLDYEQLSWAYALAQQWNVTGDDVIIAANDGARAESAYAQVRQLATLPKEQFPRTVFMFYSGNDLCGESREQFTEASDYGAALRRALVLLNRIAKEKGVSKVVVVLLEPINIMQLVVNPSIQSKKIAYGDRSYRCSEIQQPGFSVPAQAAAADARDTDRMLLRLNLLPETPSRYCGGIFKPTAEGEANRAAASRQWSAYREVIKGVAKKAWSMAQLQVVALASPAELLLDADDIAGDCFHLSYRGQFRLAAKVAESLRKVIPRHD